MVGYDNISNDNFKLLVDSVSNKLTEDLIKKDFFYEYSHILKAYNRFQEDERDSADYIYDTDNTEDSIALLRGGFSIREIKVADTQCVRIDHANTLVSVNMRKIHEYIKCYMRDIVTCAFLYGQVEEYKVLFEKEIEPLIVNL